MGSDGHRTAHGSSLCVPRMHVKHDTRGHYHDFKFVPAVNQEGLQPHAALGCPVPNGVALVIVDFLPASDEIRHEETHRPADHRRTEQD